MRVELESMLGLVCLLTSRDIGKSGGGDDESDGGVVSPGDSEQSTVAASSSAGAGAHAAGKVNALDEWMDIFPSQYPSGKGRVSGLAGDE